MKDYQLIISLKDSKSEADRIKCIPLLQDYLKENPEDVCAWYDLAKCFDFIGREQEAEPCYRKCFELGWKKLPEKEQKSFFVGYGSTLRNNLKYDESISVLQNAIQSFPDYPALKIFLALSQYSKKEDKATAETLFSTSLDSVSKGFDGYERAIKWYIENLNTYPEPRTNNKSDPEKSSDSLVPILTKRLALRNYRSEDWERVHIYGSNPDFSKYEIWGPNTLEDTHKFVSDMVKQAESNPRFNFDFAVCLKEKELLIGGCGIRRETQDSCIGNLGWAINPEFQNQGYATEAAQALIKFGFEKLNLHVIYATCDTRNTPSFKVMEKLGMKRVGFIKGNKEIKGHVRDSFRYEILRY